MATKRLSSTEKKRLDRLLEHCTESGFRNTLVEEAGGEDEAHALAWEAVANDVRWVGDLELARFLLEREPTAERAALLAAHLGRQEPPDGWGQYLPRWYIDVDTLVSRALPLAPEAFAEAEAAYEEWARLGLAFVRRRRGEVIAREDAERIAAELARSTARDTLVGRRAEITLASLPADEDAHPPEVHRFVLQTTDDVRRLAEAIAPGGGAIFDAALVETTRENRWGTIASVEPALRTMPRDALVAELARRVCMGQTFTSRGSYWVAGSDTYRMEEVLPLFEARLAAGLDTFTDLLADARQIAHDVAERGVEGGDPVLLANVLVIAAAGRALDAGEELPELEEIISFARVIDHPALVQALVARLRPLPVSRVHAWIEAVVESDGAAVAALAAHWDEGLFEKLVDGAAPIVVDAIAVIGARALPVLTRAMNALPGERGARARHAFVFALDAAIAEGRAPPEELDLELLVAAFDGRPMEREPYGPLMTAATERIVVAMPAERRKALLASAYEAAPMSVVRMLHAIPDDAELTAHLGTAVIDGMVTDWILRGLGARAVPALLEYGGRSRRGSWVKEQAERALSPADFAKVAGVFVGGETWRAIEKDVAAAIAAHPNAPRVRVYLLEKAGPSTPAREGTRSHLGRVPRGVPRARVPKDDTGEELVHILTLDFDDAPELRAKYPDGSAIALFSPSREAGSVEGSEIVVLPRAEAKTKAKERERAREAEALAVFGIDVPSDVFAPEDTLDPALRAVRDRITHASGHVFGGPFWIQTKPSEGDADGFVMQINDALNEALPVADGAVYVYEGAIFAEAL